MIVVRDLLVVELRVRRKEKKSIRSLTHYLERSGSSQLARNMLELIGFIALS